MAKLPTPETIAAAPTPDRAPSFQSHFANSWADGRPLCASVGQDAGFGSPLAATALSWVNSRGDGTWRSVR
jgi:hypothetical protein